MWENSFLQNIVYEGVGLHDLDEMKSIYTDYCKHILRNECSVMILDETETEIIAVALLEWMTGEWHSWTFLPLTISKGLFQELILMKKALMDSTKRRIEADNFDCLMVHEVGFPRSLFEDESFLMCMFDVIGEVAAHMHMPRVCFIALTAKEQYAVELADYEECGKSIYSIYKVAGNKRPFDCLRDLDEMFAILYVLNLNPILNYQLWPGFEAFQESLRAKQQKEREDDLVRANEM
ncbi:GH13170 [Drosophila grimshawi]|uniref:GH13170 n=2 Tax=Drosophila grimshawi TaxID=7222 RepID=B4JQK5_DROGR|nr:GH13170 [Drosophila grimshawi]